MSNATSKMSFTIGDHEITIDQEGARYAGFHIVTIKPYNAQGSSLLHALTGTPAAAQRVTVQQGVHIAESLADPDYVCKLARYCAVILYAGKTNPVQDADDREMW